MLSFSRRWGVMGLGLALLWAAAASAQSSASLKSGPGRNPAAGGSTANPVICDSSGQVCVAPGQRASALTAKAASVKAASTETAISASAATVSPPSGATAQLQSPKPVAVAAVTLPLICDASGKICRAASSPFVPAVARFPSKTELQPALLKVTPNQIDGASIYDGLEAENAFDWVVHAYKSRHRLEVYYKGHLYRTYNAVFGRSLESGAKLWEGDRRTPEGDYLIIGKHRSSRFGWFLHINYPNTQDRERFEESRAEHLIPASAGEGGQIGIHGTDSPYLNVADVDWTTGCISVDNTDIQELAELLPVGTLVVINP